MFKKEKYVKFKIPDWANERTMYVHFGREAYLIRNPDGTTYIKTVRCNQCGKCCQEPGGRFPTYIPEGEDVEYCAYCEYDRVDKPTDLMEVLQVKYQILEKSRIPVRTYANIVKTGGVPDQNSEDEIVKWLRQLQLQLVYGQGG